MITLIPNVLTADELAQVRSGLEVAPFISGDATAAGSARKVKNNQQLAQDTDAYKQLASIVRNAFMRNAILHASVLPAFFTTVMFNRYADGMEYGPHIDMPLMGVVGNLLRADVAITLFLSNPDSYVGGELTMEQAGGVEHKFKGEAGSAIAYPANMLHHVTPVKSGARLAAVVWVQSLVRDPAKREILWELGSARQDLYNRGEQNQTYNFLNRSHSNLLRMWSDV